jgi:urease accessory protein UreF
MALENGGLDAQVEQRMDAYRSNPQQLQQRYGQNKELLDLLALQKLTSEKQAAARDMQMKMQQQPGTIAQQREQEALELTKQEMGSTLGELAGRTKGTLDQKQAMQQQNMQKMAQGQPPVAQGGIGALMGGQQARPPMQGVPPQAQGLANARMQAPVQMAKGGIVSFAGADGNNEVVGPGTPFSRFMELPC